MDGNEIQLKITGILTTQSNVTVSLLAKRLRVRPHSIRYQLDKLVESKSLEKAILINQRTLGFQVFNLFFNLPVTRAKKATEFLKSRKEVAWFTRNIGPRRYEMTVVVRDFTTLSKMFRDMGDVAGTLPRDVIIAVEGEVIHWGLRFLTESYSKTPIAHFTTPEETVTIDSLDREIITHFMSQGTMRDALTVPKLKVSPSTIKYRLDKLRVSGVISEEAYFIRPTMKMIQAQLMIHLRSRASEIENEIASICANNPHVECLIAGVGNWDYKLLIDAESLPALLEVEEQLVQTLGRSILKHCLYIRDKVFCARAGL
jgi:DNA-binding Lrp family transcriptional regulator